jgi:hypothetical protein
MSCGYLLCYDDTTAAGGYSAAVVGGKIALFRDLWTSRLEARCLSSNVQILLSLCPTIFSPSSFAFGLRPLIFSDACTAFSASGLLFAVQYPPHTKWIQCHSDRV